MLVCLFCKKSVAPVLNEQLQTLLAHGLGQRVKVYGVTSQAGSWSLVEFYRAPSSAQSLSTSSLVTLIMIIPDTGLGEYEINLPMALN